MFIFYCVQTFKEPKYGYVIKIPASRLQSLPADHCGYRIFNASGKAILGYSATYPNYGIWYFDESSDVMTFSASGNANSKTGADLAIGVHGVGTLAIRNNRIPHTGNTTGTVGSGTQPVWVDGGTIKATSYAVSSTVNSGTANRVAYYSAATTIDDAANIWTDGTYLAVNGTTRAVTLNGYSSTTNVSLAVTGSIFTTNNLMTNAAVAIYKGGTGNGLVMRGAGDYVYGKMSIEALGTASAVGNGRITLGNSTAEGTVGNAQGQMLLYGSSAYFISIRPDALTANVLLGATATHFTMPRLWLTETTDAAGNAANAVPLMIGPQTGAHMEIDGNEILAKSNGTTYATLYLQDNASATTRVVGELQVSKKIKGEDEIWGTNLCMTGGSNGVYSQYSDTWYPVVKGYNNGNITVNAASGVLSLGYVNTTSIHIRKMLQLTSSQNYATSTPSSGQTTGDLFFTW